MTARNGGRCAASARAAAATMRWRCRKPRAVTCGCRCKTVLPAPTVCAEVEIKDPGSANRPTRSSKWSRATRRAAISPRLFRRAGLLDAGRHRWRQRQRCCRPTVRSRPGRAVLDRAVSSSPGGKLTTWADADPQPFLPEGYLPMPGVRWRQPQWELSVSSFASGARGSSWLVARYEITNRTRAAAAAGARRSRIRPSRSTRQRQFLNTVGGVSAIRDIAWDGTAFTVNDQRKVYALQRPDRIGAVLFRRRRAAQAAGAFGLGRSESRSRRFRLCLRRARLQARPPAAWQPRPSTWSFPCPAAAAPRSAPHARQRPGWRAQQRRRRGRMARKTQSGFTARFPGQRSRWSTRSAPRFAHILMTRDGPMLRPGTRSYARSWIRDGAMIAESLLRLGDAGVAAEYLRWYAPHQFASGKIPCCVDQRGADPVPENDSAGEFIFLAAEIYRYTHDRALIEAMWPHVQAAARYPRRPAALRAHRCQSRAGQARVLRAAAGIDQPRGLFGKADAFVLGRLLGIEGIRRRDRYRHRARPRRGSGPPARRARYLSPRSCRLAARRRRARAASHTFRERPSLAISIRHRPPSRSRREAT